MKAAFVDILVVSFKTFAVMVYCSLFAAFTDVSMERMVIAFTLFDLYLYKREVARK